MSDDILAVHGLFVEPDDDDPDTLVVLDTERTALASIYVDNVAETVSVKLVDGHPIAMCTLDQAYKWVVSHRVEAEKQKAEESTH
jgi:hypothetical protein